MTARILIEGRPGSGKTTAARRLAELIRRRGLAPAGFTTEEIRRGSTRQGFAVEDLDGRRETLAHVDLRGPPRVGKYGVDLEAFERVALPALGDARRADVAVIDELGKMELASGAFREAVEDLFERDVPVAATVHAFRHPLTDALKRRSDVEVVKLSARNRDRLPEDLAALLSGRALSR